MSIFDGDENAINIRTPTLGGTIFWDTLDAKAGYELQQHKVTKHCRILNQHNVRIAWGDEGPMLAAFQELVQVPASFWEDGKSIFNIQHPTLGGYVFWDRIKTAKGYELQRNKITKLCRILDHDNVCVAWGDELLMLAKFDEMTRLTDTIKAKFGDIIGVHRAFGLYDHYGVYVSDNCVYEYGMDQNGTQCIHTTTLEMFVRDSDGYFILVFPETYGALGKIHVGEKGTRFRIRQHNISSSNLLIPGWKRKIAENYRIYTPDETVSRAESRLGEEKYNLLFSNCEHYAIWCKTGMKDSHQVDILLNLIPENIF